MACPWPRHWACREGCHGPRLEPGVWGIRPPFPWPACSHSQLPQCPYELGAGRQPCVHYWRLGLSGQGEQTRTIPLQGRPHPTSASEACCVANIGPHTPHHRLGGKLNETRAGSQVSGGRRDGPERGRLEPGMSPQEAQAGAPHGMPAASVAEQLSSSVPCPPLGTPPNHAGSQNSL